MIHVHRWQGLTAASRESWVEAYRPGVRIRDVADEPALGVVLRNGQECSPDDVLDDYDHVDLMAYPGLPGLTAKALISTLLISTAVTFAVRALMPEPEKAKERGDERSPTHGFGRLANIRAEGQPIPVIYGEHLTAGTIFNEFVEVNNATGESTYYALVGLGHGPIYSIGGETVDTPDVAPLTSEDKTTPNTIFLQGNPLANFHQTKVWVRLGSNEQSLVPGFEKSRTAYEVGVELTSEPVGVLAPNDLIPQIDYGSDQYESVWDDQGFAWDVQAEDVDGTEVIMHFPGGLYAIDSTGTLGVTRWVLGIRFCKLDDSGTPVLGPGFGGNADDGWVRLPFEEFTLDRQNPFQLAFPVPFYDPTDFIDPVPGDAWQINIWGAAGHYLRTIQTVDRTRRPDSWNPGVFGTGALAASFTFECWVALDWTAASGPFSFSGPDHSVPLFEWSSSGTVDGVWCGFIVTENDEWYPHFQVGKWGRFHTWPDVRSLITPTTDANDKQWHHIIFSHQRLGPDTNVTRFWINGLYLGEFVHNIDIIVPDPANAGSGYAQMKVGWSNQIRAADNSVRGWWDEVIVHDDFFDGNDAALRWNGGDGARHSDADPDAVMLLHIEGGLTDSTGYANHAELQGNGNLAPGEGKITKFVTPARTRGRYRVQCVRVNGEAVPAAQGGERVQDNAEWQLAVTWIDQAFVFPGIAYTALIAEATEQLNTSAPTVTQVARGRPVRVWDRISTVAPTFTRRWSRNPAWVALDVATDEEYGGGQAFAIENVNLDAFAALADRCDERTYDARGQRHFYRQDYEASANKCNSPTNIDAFWSLTAGSPVVTLNTVEAPNGAFEADKIEDTNGSQNARRGFQFSTSTEPSFYAASAFVRKDGTVTGHSCGIRIIVNAVTTEVSFNIDTGEAVANCTVEDYDDDWWLVKATPVYHSGIGLISCFYMPAAFTRGTTTEDVSLTGEFTVWGFSIHRGKTHVPHPGADGPRAYIFMANEDADGNAQVLPQHWVAGYELRIRNAQILSWDTDTGVALEIVEVNTIDVMDGYDRVWQIVVKWPAAQDAPDGAFPDLVSDGRDWTDIAGEWTLFGGVTATAEFDDGAQTGGPDDADPRFSTVCKIEGATAITDPIKQALPGSVSGLAITARAHIYKPDTGTNPQFELFQSASNFALLDPPSIGWNKVEVSLNNAGSSTTIGIAMGAALSDFWWDGVGCWVTSDASGNVPGGTIEGAEALFQYDAVHDTFKGLWDTLVNILLTCRAMPVREGNRLSVKYEADLPVVGLVTMGTVVNSEGESTFRTTYVSDKQRPNSVVIDFHDREKNWERSTVSVDDPALEESADEGLVRRESYFLLGVTRRSQVIRHALFHLAVNRTIIREGVYDSDPTAITYEPGDVIAMSHDLVPWGQGGRVVHSSAQGANLALDTEAFDLWNVPTGEIEVTVNSMSTPDGRPVADLVETLVDAQTSLEQTLGSVDSAERYCFSIRVKRLVGSRFGLAAIQASGDTIIVEYDWALGTLSQITAIGGVTLTVIQEADGWVRLGFDIVAANTNDIDFVIIPERLGTALLGTKVWLADAQIESGVTEPGAYDRPGTGIWIDREVTLELGVTYNCRVVSGATGESESGQVTSGAGVYEVGERLEFVPGSISFNPQEGDTYLIYSDAERMEAMVTALRINEDLSVGVEWVQYDSSIFDGDDLGEEDLEELLSSSSPPGSGDSPIADPQHGTLIPGSPVRVSVLEMSTVGPAGMPQPLLDVAWQSAEESQRDVAENRVFLAFLDEEHQAWTQPRLAGTAPGSASSLQVPLPQSVEDRLCWVMIQPVSFGGARRAPRQCDGQVLRLCARHPAPDPPTNFLAHMEGDRIVFTWDAPAVGPDGLVYEVRHGGASPKGGWVLAQKVGETSDLRLGPTDRWATAGATAPRYYLRARNRHGVYSDVVTLDYGARVLNATLLTSANHWWSYISQDWHDYVDGWKTDSAPPIHDPVLAGLQRHADGYLEFSSGLTGTYTTALIPSGEIPTHFEHEERVRIETHLIATCLDPTPIGESNYNSDGTTKQAIEALERRIGNPWAGNRTMEGNLQGALPTITIQMKLVRDDLTAAGSPPGISSAVDSEGSSGWIDYTPGVYVCHGAQFRLVVTRPTTDWEVHIWEFRTACYRALAQRHYRTPVERRLARRHGLG